ncbi:MAG: MarR family winged helix-turn-helix transcriptional regulator [Hyphomicrobiaceae bacterium]
MGQEDDLIEQQNSLFQMLHRAEQRAKALFAKEVAEHGLTVRQFVILSAVGANEGAMLMDIVSLTGIDRSTMTEVIGRMVARGLLARKRSPQDARKYMVRTTSAGREKLALAEIASKRASEEFLAALPSGQRNCFVHALMLAANFDAS